MTSSLELYYFPGSFYSQKAYLTLLEKDLPFKENIIVTVNGDQYQESFLRLNPNGQVPVLKNGSDVIYESEAIIDYLDKTFSSGSSLVPDLGRAVGQRVTETRKFLDAVPVELITYGVYMYSEFRPTPNELPKMFLEMVTVEKMKKDIENKIADSKERLKKNPSLREALEKKIEQCEWRLKNWFDKEKVKQALLDLGRTFDRMNSQLQRVQNENGTDTVWLCGTSITAADISAAILFNRLKLLGLDQEHYSATKRPRVLQYKDRLFARPSMKKLVADLSNDKILKLLQKKAPAGDTAKETSEVTDKGTTKGTTDSTEKGASEVKTKDTSTEKTHSGMSVPMIVIGAVALAAIAFGVKLYIDNK